MLKEISCHHCTLD